MGCDLRPPYPAKADLFQHLHLCLLLILCGHLSDCLDQKVGVLKRSVGRILACTELRYYGPICGINEGL